MKRIRADILAVTQGLFESREQAKRAIMAGIVYELTTQERVDKPGTSYKEETLLEVKGKKIPYVSRGGLKLKDAIDTFNINITQKNVLDIGSSTGGFTDCCLQEGATHVYALDVGTQQLAWKLRNDARVSVLEQTNFRYATIDLFQRGLPDILVTDVSFISLTLIFQQVFHLFGQEKFQMIALIKPQFEAGKECIGKNGIVRDPKIHQQVIDKIITEIIKYGWIVHGYKASPILGAKGNKEYLIYFENKGGI